MRISAKLHDPGHMPHYRWAVVYLDGSPVTHVVTADEEQCAVVVEEVDERGWPVLALGGERIRLRVLVGDVRIRFRPDAPGWVRQDFPDRVEVAA